MNPIRPRVVAPASTLRFRAILALPLAAALPACGGDEPVALLDYRTEAPAGWEPREPANRMRVAEFAVPARGGEEAAVVVYYFGPGQGGSAEANIARWSSQFSTADGGAVEPEVDALEGTAFPTTVATLTGTYARGMGMGPGRQEPEPGQRLIAAVVETSRGNLYIQLFGDEASVTAEREPFLDFVRGIRPLEGGGGVA